MSYIRAMTGIGLVLALTAPQMASAQAEAAASAQDAGGDSGSLADIVVTAQRRSESANRIPVPLSVVGGEALAKLGVRSAQDLAIVVPGFSASESYTGLPIFRIRGVGFDSSYAGLSSPVGIYYDEASYAYPFFASGPIFDIERVEVLKGPQGTLYGRNTTAGLVDFITNKPTTDPSASVTAELGNYETHNLEGFVSGPINDRMQVRVAGRVEQSDEGWQRSITRGDRLGKVDRLAARLSLAWQPTDTVDVALRASYWRDRSDTQAPQALGFSETGATSASLFPAGYPNSFLPRQKANLADWNPNTPEGLGAPGYGESLPRYFSLDNRMYALAGQVDFHLSDTIILSSLTSYNDAKRDAVNDVDGTAFRVAEQYSTAKIRSFSQELKLGGKSGDLTWLAGAYYAHDKIPERDLTMQQDLGSLIGLRLLGVSLPPSVKAPYSDDVLLHGLVNSDNNVSQTVETRSLFGDATFDVSDRFSLTGGLRYTRSTVKLAGCPLNSGITAEAFYNVVFKTIFGTTENIHAGQCAILNDDLLTFHNGAAVFHDTLKENSLSFRAIANWKPTSTSLLYASISRGTKAGGFPNIGVLVVSEYAPAKQEKLLAYEVGAKLGLLDRRIQLNVSGFYYDYKDKQILSSIADPLFGSLPKFINIPKSRAYGVDADVTVRATPELTLTMAGLYLNTRITDYQGIDVGGSARDFRGYPFSNSPKWQLSGSIDYARPISSTLGAELLLNGSYQSKAIGVLSFNPLYRLKAYGLLNATLSLYSLDKHWRVSGYAENLTNTYYWGSALISASPSTAIRFAGRPRQYGLRLTYGF